MIDKKLKIRIKTYYETHIVEVKELSKKFNIAERTIYKWIKNENWQQGLRMLEPINKDDFIKDELVSKIEAYKKSAKAKILGSDCLVDEEIINDYIDEVLLKTMSLEFLDKSIIESAIVAKQKLKDLVFSSQNYNKKDNLQVINACEKVVSIFNSAKSSIHGKDEKQNINVVLNNNLSNLNSFDVANMSDEELKRILNQKGDL